MLLVLASLSLLYFSCSEKDKKTDRFNFLINNIWVSDSLLVNGIDASGAGGLLEDFVGEADFKPDGTGDFGDNTGSWYFTNNEEDITITSEALPFPLTCNIAELTAVSFKLTTSFTHPLAGQLDIRITFKAK